MKNLLKTLLALTLALALVFSSAVSVLATDMNDKIKVVNDKVYVGGSTTPDQALTESHELDGDLTVENGDPALSVYTSSFTVTGTVSDKPQNDNDVTAVKVEGYRLDARVNIGEVVAEATGTDDKVEANGIKAIVYSDYDFDEHRGSAEITVEKGVQATSTASGDGHNAKATAVDAKSQYAGDMNIHIKGNAEAVATSDESAEAYAIYAKAEGANPTAAPYVGPEPSVNTVTVDGKAIAKATAGEGNEAKTKEAAVYAEAKEKSELKVTVGKGAEGSIQAQANDGSKTTVEILGGGVVAENVNTNPGDGAVTAVNNNSTVDVIIVGGVDSTGSGTAVSADATGEKATTTLTLTDGDISETDEMFATGADFSVHDKGTLTASINTESVTATVKEPANTDPKNQSKTVGLDLTNHGGTLDVVGETNIVATGADMNTGIQVSSFGSEIKVNKVGTEAVDLYVPQEVIDTGIDVTVGSESGKAFKDNGQWYFKANTATDQNIYEVTVEETFVEGETNLTLTGNVTADNIGIEIDIADPQTANILIDGTVEGGDAGIVLTDQTKIDENLTLTVWQVVPTKDKDGNEAVVFTKSTDDTGKTVYTENEEAEKLIRYIIKIADDSKDYITGTTGTEDVTAGNGETYQVAYEQDTVTLKLEIPKDKELIAVYGDDGQEVPLEKDADGNYYVVVPRGGGVILSVDLKNVDPPTPPTPPDPPTPPTPPEPGPAPDNKPAQQGIVVSKVLATVTDTTGTIELAFYSDGTYISKNKKTNATEHGHFKLENDQIVVINSAKHEMPLTKDGTGWKLLYTSGTDTTPYEFKIKDADVQILFDNLK